MDACTATANSRQNPNHPRIALIARNHRGREQSRIEPDSTTSGGAA
jgi:hypothetical protein